MWLIRRFDTLLLEQRGHLFPWAPVFMALGIGIYFQLQWEPELVTYAVLAVPAVVALLVVWWRPAGVTALGWAVVLGVLGFTLAGFRAHDVSGPVLTWRYYGPVEGRVVALDRSSSDKLRVTLDKVRLNRVSQEKLPQRVRLSLHGHAAEAESVLTPGARVMTTGHLMPPQGPAEPGGFDFRRHAWFQKLGAVGYTRAPILLAEDPLKNPSGLQVFRLRMAASERIRETLKGDTGGFAAAITTGDRSAVSLSAIQALRDSNLAHLLAISGLHMGLLAGFVFAFLRTALALIPPLALRLPVRRLAAAGALAVATGYLLLSGERVAADDALKMGLCHDVVPAAQLDERIERLVHNVLSGSPAALRLTKEHLQRCSPTQVLENLQPSIRVSAQARETSDAREGLAAFLEKRKPAWQPDSQSE